MSTIRIFRHYLRVPFLLLGIADAIIFTVSLYLGSYVRFIHDPAAIPESIGALGPRAVVFAVILIVSMLSMGLYQARLREGTIGVLLRILASFLLGGLALALVFYVFPQLFLGRGALALAFGFAFIGAVIVRIAFYRTVDQEALKRRVLVVGTGKRAASITRFRRRVDQRGFRVIGFVHVKGEHDEVDSDRIIHLDGPLVEFALAKGVDEIVVAIDDRRRSFPMDQLLDCRMSGIDVIETLTFYEREFGKIRLDLLHPSWMVFTDGYAQGVMRAYGKRAFDVLASLILLAVTWPIILLAAIAVIADHGWGQPVLYRQVRTGVNGRPFSVLKFRSMVPDAEKDGKAQWATKNDNRVTRVGRFIRKTRIDELPQIFNVLRGDMSFVGPRPERPEFVEELADEIPYYRERHRVKPGVSGWAQLCYPYGSSVDDAREKLQYDLYYVKNHSLLLDLIILLQTAEVVIFGKGAR